ncbi:MAG: ArnT family glycosyltransferase [Armatimonadota bacterium]
MRPREYPRTSDSEHLMAENPDASVKGSGPRRTWLWVLLGVHLVLASVYVAILPHWGAVPDEPLHYSHAKYVAEFWELPIWQAPQRDLREYYFTADPASTSHHGPVYYWPLAAIYHLTDWMTLTGQLYVFRAWSVLLGLPVVWLAWRSFELLFPDRPTCVIAGTAFATILPYRVMLSAVIYADAAAILFSSLAIYLSIRALTIERERLLKAWLWAGIALGVSIVTKQSTLVLVPGLAVLILWRWRRDRMGATSLLSSLGAWVGGVALTAGWWYIRNLMDYGELMPIERGTGLRSWSAVLSTVPTDSLIWQIGYVVRGTWLSTWSQVGWLPNFAASWMLGALLAISALVVLGLVLGARERYGGLSWQAVAATAASALMVLGVYAGSVHWCLLYSFHNNEEGGKFLQQAIIAFALVMMVGLRGLLGKLWSLRFMWLLIALLVIYHGLAMWNITQVLNPRWAPDPPALAGRKVEELPSGSVAGIQHRYNVPGTEKVYDYKSGRKAGEDDHQRPPGDQR